LCSKGFLLFSDGCTEVQILWISAFGDGLGTNFIIYSLFGLGRIDPMLQLIFNMVS